RKTAVNDEVGRRTGVVLRASSGRKRRRARGRREDVGRGEQRRSKEVGGHQAPASGNLESVIAELIHDPKLVGHKERGGQVAGKRGAERQGGAVQAESSHPVARDETVEQFAGGERVGFSARVIHPSREVDTSPVVALKTELLGGKVIAVVAVAEIAEV